MAKRQKTTRFSIKDFDMAHYRATEQYANAVDNLFAVATEEIARAASKADFNPDKPFTFDDYPKVKSAMQTIVAGLTKKVQTVVETGSRKQWLFSCKKNDAFIKSVFDTTKLKKSDLKQMMDKRLDALATFQGRKVAGMNLSQRVWKYTTQFREQIEHALDVGLGEGRSAQELSRDVRQNLKDPNRLFRRVRDKRGNLVLSKAAQAFHPGQGVYRSSYKNAMRLTRSEINMAYRESDYQRWQALDFVVGFEIMRSNHEPLCKCSTCEKLVGRYPKTFKFVGWHPQCMCFAIPIMEDFYSEGRRNDRVNRLKAALNGTTAKKYISPETIDKMPDGFNEWVDAHKDIQKNWSSTPYFIRDNFKNGNLADGLKISIPVVPASVKIDPLAALMPSIENARQLATKWGLNSALQSLNTAVNAKNVVEVQRCINDIQTQGNGAETEYNTYITDARKAINDAHTAQVDATEVESDLNGATSDIQGWVTAKVIFKQRLSNLLAKIGIVGINPAMKTDYKTNADVNDTMKQINTGLVNKWFEHDDLDLVVETNPGNNGSTNLNGLIKLTQVRIDGVKSAMAKIGNGKWKDITEGEADAMATFWHEITHNRNKPQWDNGKWQGANFCNTSLQRSFMELANEYVARNTLPEFYKTLGCPQTPHPQFMKSRDSTGYNDMVTNYDYVVTKLKLKEKKVLDAVRSHLYNKPYNDQQNGLINGLIKGGIKDKDGKKLKKSVVKSLVGIIRSTQNSASQTKEQILDDWLKANNII